MDIRKSGDFGDLELLKNSTTMWNMFVHVSLPNIYNLYFKRQNGFRNNIWIAPIFIAEQEIPEKTAEGKKIGKEKIF